jgi:hypothetical protein
MGSMYCYRVTAIYISETDQCESALSKEVCVIWTGTGKNHDKPENFAHIFPNPASDHVSIQTSAEIEKITVYNALGINLYNKKTNGYHFELNSKAYPAGTYLIRLETDRGVTTRVLTIKR